MVVFFKEIVGFLFILVRVMVNGDMFLKVLLIFGLLMFIVILKLDFVLKLRLILVF